MRLQIQYFSGGVLGLLLLLGLARGAAAKEKKHATQSPQPIRATLQPQYAIPITPLGFAPPGELYIGSRVSQASLDFLDDDHLLFTFRVPALIRRDSHAESESDERRIRAYVLHLPDGAVESEAIWTVHDRARYLYMLDHGQYLVRDRDSIYSGDASLQLKPYLHFPGNVLWVELDPGLQYLVTGSEEPARQPVKSADGAGNGVVAPSLSSGGPTDAAAPKPQTNLILRILKRSTGEVMLTSHVDKWVHVPLNSGGYLESVHAHGNRWILNYNMFGGGSAPVAPVQSYCSPLVDFLAEDIFLVTGCDSTGAPGLTALTMGGQRLWEAPPVGPSAWPVLVYSRDGQRFARETLMATHEVNARSPLDVSEIKGQDVQIIDTASGKVVLRAAASPVLDAGGNLAISPDDRRVVILIDGALQVFSLPQPLPLPEVKTKK